MSTVPPELVATNSVVRKDIKILLSQNGYWTRLGVRPFLPLTSSSSPVKTLSGTQRSSVTQIISLSLVFVFKFIFAVVLIIYFNYYKNLKITLAKTILAIWNLVVLGIG